MIHKFRAKRTIVDGITFHSKKEAKRYAELKILERVGEIQDLTLQQEFPYFMDGGIKAVFTYIADFTYFNASGEWIVEDVKGIRTALYRLKKKIIEHAYNIKITET